MFLTASIRTANIIFYTRLRLKVIEIALKSIDFYIFRRTLSILHIITHAHL